MEDKSLILVLIVIILLALCFSATAIIAFFNVYKKRILEKEARIKQIDHEKKIQLFKAGAEGEERQKEKIARDLHDDLIPTISAVYRNLEQFVVEAKEKGWNVDTVISDLSNLEQITETIRGISYDLIPSTFLTLGLIEALRYHVDQISEPKARTSFKNESNFDSNTPLSKAEQLSVYRICKELLNNLYKHAKYTFLNVTVESEGNDIVIDFLHDGKGVTNDEIELYCNRTNGLGLKSLNLRALLLEAKINYYTEVGSLAGVKLSIPLKHE